MQGMLKRVEQITITGFLAASYPTGRLKTVRRLVKWQGMSNGTMVGLGVDEWTVILLNSNSIQKVHL